MSPREEAIAGYSRVIGEAEARGESDLALRQLCLDDLFFLLVYVLGGQFANNDWVFARCREFAADPDGHLDLWPREHYKSTIITLAAAVQEILRNPEITIGIFSFNRPSAKVFLRQIKTHFEVNEKLKALFPDILYADPQKEAPKWSEDDGIVVRRQGIPREMTVEAWGLIDAMPTGRHFMLRIYDDVVEKSAVTSPDMIAKVTEAMSLSFNLGKEGGRMWMAGTRYHYADTYSSLIARGAVKLRLYAATVDGSFDGEPVLWTRETLKKKIKEMGIYVASCQLFNRPVMEGDEIFDVNWLEYWTPRNWHKMNRYITVDPAGEQKKGSDSTVFIVWGLGADRNYYIIDMLRDKLDLVSRTRVLFSLHAEYRPLVVGYEKYGMQSDIEYIKETMDRQQYRFRIEPLGGIKSKLDRIKRLQPICQEHRLYIPDKLMRVVGKGADRRAVDMTQALINDEYVNFPYMEHDDMLDCAARIMDEDMHAFFPQGQAKGSSGLPAYAEDDDSAEYSYSTYDYLDQARQ